MNNDFRYMKFIYVHCGEETNIRDPRCYRCYYGLHLTALYSCLNLIINMVEGHYVC